MNDKTPPVTDPGRRRLLARGGAMAAVLSAVPGLLLTLLARAKPPEQPASSKQRWGILIDTHKCMDCTVCVDACNREHGLDRGDEWRSSPEQKAQWIRKVDLRDRATGHRQSLPVLCQHCEFPPCVDVCPTGASFRRADGIVLVDKHICIGCRYCMMACPYKARSFIHEDLTHQLPYAPRGKGTVESCTLCVHRVDADRIPACVEACNAYGGQSMWFGDLNDPDSAISRQLAAYPSSQIRADLNLNTGVRYRGI